MMKRNIWVRVAGNAKNVRAGSRYGWRCFLGDESGVDPKKEISLVHWSFTGAANEHNAIPGISSNGTSQEVTVLAWIDLYGDVAIENDTLHVTLRNPLVKNK